LIFIKALTVADIVLEEYLVLCFPKKKNRFFCEVGKKKKKLFKTYSRNYTVSESQMMNLKKNWQ
jgi:hypothetical protein